MNLYILNYHCSNREVVQWTPSPQPTQQDVCVTAQITQLYQLFTAVEMTPPERLVKSWQWSKLGQGEPISRAGCCRLLSLVRQSLRRLSSSVTGLPAPRESRNALLSKDGDYCSCVMGKYETPTYLLREKYGVVSFLLPARFIFLCVNILSTTV